MAYPSELEQLSECLQTIQRFLRRNVEVKTAKQVITRVQWLILWNLFRYEERTIGQLAQSLDVRSSTMSQMIDRLELAKLVIRSADLNDARSRVVSLTEDGKEIIQKLKNLRLDLLLEPFSQLEPQEQTALVQLLTKLTKKLRKRSDE